MGTASRKKGFTRNIEKWSGTKPLSSLGFTAFRATHDNHTCGKGSGSSRRALLLCEGLPSNWRSTMACSPYGAFHGIAASRGRWSCGRLHLLSVLIGGAASDIGAANVHYCRSTWISWVVGRMILWFHRDDDRHTGVPVEPL